MSKSKSKISDAKKEVQEALKRDLKLKEPLFELECVGTKVSGSVISSTFRGMRDSERQRLIWDALEARYGEESVQRVGSLLAFTPDEWELDEGLDPERCEAAQRKPAGG